MSRFWNPSGKHTCQSLWYPVVVLGIGGWGLLLLPSSTLTILGSNGNYGEIMPRLAGMMFLGLGCMVYLTIHFQVRPIYPWTVGIRAFFWLCLWALYIGSGDPFFLTVLALLTIGLVWTLLAMNWDAKIAQGLP